MSWDGIHMATCAECGKEFIIYPLHAYKLIKKKSHGTAYFCSWSCIQKARYRNQYENPKTWGNNRKGN